MAVKKPMVTVSQMKKAMALKTEKEKVSLI